MIKSGHGKNSLDWTIRSQVRHIMNKPEDNSVPNKGKKASTSWLAKEYPPLQEGYHICYLLQFPGFTHKVYVGQTNDSLRKRVSCHTSAAKQDKIGGCAALKAAINLYDRESMLKFILSQLYRLAKLSNCGKLLRAKDTTVL